MPCRGAIAHGFQVLELGSELLNLHSGAWVPKAETGVRFDDTQLAISWPLPRLGLSSPPGGRHWQWCASALFCSCHPAESSLPLFQQPLPN